MVSVSWCPNELRVNSSDVLYAHQQQPLSLRHYHGANAYNPQHGYTWRSTKGSIRHRLGLLRHYVFCVRNGHSVGIRWGTLFHQDRWWRNVSRIWLRGWGVCHVPGYSSGDVWQGMYLQRTLNAFDECGFDIEFLIYGLYIQIKLFYDHTHEHNTY